MSAASRKRALLESAGQNQQWLFEATAAPAGAPVPDCSGPEQLVQHVRGFNDFGAATREGVLTWTTPERGTATVPMLANEFWTARQRQANSLHEISYRACFKPQLPRFFIERLTASGGVVYDPFMGRGTTLIEAALLGRVPWGCDINPLSRVLIGPRLNPPTLSDIAQRLKELPLDDSHDVPEDLLAFYHPETLKRIVALKQYFLSRRAEGTIDATDEWICMVAVNRLTGHSNGFFSVYTLPPNQAVSVESQRKINAQRNQVPPQRDLAAIILRKSRILLSDVDDAVRRRLASVCQQARLVINSSAQTSELPSDSVDLVVTSPPFLDVVDYATDNWLRCWFLGIDAQSVAITKPGRLENWQAAMSATFQQLARLLKPGGYVAFEVGEVRGGKLKLEEAVLPCGVGAGLEAVAVIINEQFFTKTANCWGVDNNSKGTNSNRIVVFRKPAR